MKVELQDVLDIISQLEREYGDLLILNFIRERVLAIDTLQRPESAPADTDSGHDGYVWDDDRRNWFRREDGGDAT